VREAEEAAGQAAREAASEAEQAAIKMQSMARARFARGQVDGMARVAHAEREVALKMAAAVRVQAVVRGHSVRLATTLSSAEQQAAATKVQSFQRGRKARQGVQLGKVAASSRALPRSPLPYSVSIGKIGPDGRWRVSIQRNGYGVEPVCALPLAGKACCTPTHGASSAGALTEPSLLPPCSPPLWSVSISLSSSGWRAEIRPRAEHSTDVGLTQVPAVVPPAHRFPVLITKDGDGMWRVGIIRVPPPCGTGLQPEHHGTGSVGTATARTWQALIRVGSDGRYLVQLQRNTHWGALAPLTPL